MNDALAVLAFQPPANGERIALNSAVTAAVRPILAWDISEMTGRPVARWIVRPTAPATL
jgi:hypothetical protein